MPRPTKSRAPRTRASSSLIGGPGQISLGPTERPVCFRVSRPPRPGWPLYHRQGYLRAENAVGRAIACGRYAEAASTDRNDIALDRATPARFRMKIGIKFCDRPQQHAAYLAFFVIQPILNPSGAQGGDRGSKEEASDGTDRSG
jgi:hypothetical protein